MMLTLFCFKPGSRPTTVVTLAGVSSVSSRGMTDECIGCDDSVQAYVIVALIHSGSHSLVLWLKRYLIGLSDGC